MLWRSSTITADDECARQGVRIRLGKPGVPWAGYRVGSWVHDYIRDALRGVPRAERPKLGMLSPLEQQDAMYCLRRFQEMGLLENAPASAVVEQTYIGLVIAPNDEDGLYGGMVGGWAEAPPEAVRGPDFDPASFQDETWYALQPDRHYLDEAPDLEGLPKGQTTVATGDDWKSAMSEPNENKVDYRPQPVTYGAFLADFYNVPDDHIVRFNLWYLRHGTCLRVERTAGWFRGMSRRYLEACWRRDQVAAKVHEGSPMGGEHCTSCPFRGLKCSGTVWSDTLPLEAKWRAVERLSGMVKREKEDVKAAMKRLTSRLPLPDGTIIGPLTIHPLALSRKADHKVKVSEALAVVAHWALDAGEFHTMFKRDGSLQGWLDRLPTEPAWVRSRTLPEWVDRKDLATHGDEAEWTAVSVRGLFNGLTTRHNKVIYIEERPRLAPESEAS